MLSKVNQLSSNSRPNRESAGVNLSTWVSPTHFEETGPCASKTISFLGSITSDGETHEN